MIVAANRVPITKGYEQEFEKRFERRLGAVDKTPGFIRNEVLRPIVGDHYVVLTYWESREAFEAWTQSESFRLAHANPAPKEMFAGRSQLEMHEVILVSEKKS
ncbi:antibiotic biosynthesis monooxygenase [Candidatus Methylomirabilis lanthanidiphila]|uniref:Antibiotic biosynthesis monooxygenase n=1 Tax=Candidatus Methylomirabilis lanthanidiphila TaxID=2211376 RepID=A0A564ZKL5_9BACT|nr:antibiotic biosynthesis monooxygenase [Candidatus Methylomirabilis lanthanidiphila]VUZ85723.1 antibiotic biosynthesis monooxygenase [Candidatus Methylomirabilis lanthanidiphila]